MLTNELIIFARILFLTSRTRKYNEGKFLLSFLSEMGVLKLRPNSNIIGFFSELPQNACGISISSMMKVQGLNTLFVLKKDTWLRSR